MNRRTFLGTSAAAALLAARPSWAGEASRKIDRLGVQLYTVRAAMKNDFEGTLAKVAAAGYQEVEFAGYFEQAPKAIREMLDRHGLAAPAAHIDYASIDKKLPQFLDAAHILGHQFIVCPWIDEAQRRSRGGWQQAAEFFNRAGAACQKAGMQFGYHNHDFEFHADPALDGKLPYDFLLAETDPQLVKMEMDLCWITVGGQDPLTYFDRYPGRFPLVHVKDMTKDSHMTEVGSGAIDWKRIFAQSEKAGILHYFVEHDEPAAPFDSIRKSAEFLHALRF